MCVVAKLLFVVCLWFVGLVITCITCFVFPVVPVRLVVIVLCTWCVHGLSVLSCVQ